MPFKMNNWAALRPTVEVLQLNQYYGMELRLIGLIEVLCLAKLPVGLRYVVVDIKGGPILNVPFEGVTTTTTRHDAVVPL